MLTREEIKDVVENISIPWELHLLEDKRFKDADGKGRLYLQIQFDDIDNKTGEQGYRAHCRKWYLSEYMTSQEVVRTAYKAYEAAVIHEMQEKFLYKGKRIYDPHLSAEALVEIAENTEHRLTESFV